MTTEARRVRKLPGLLCMIAGSLAAASCSNNRAPGSDTEPVVTAGEVHADGASEAGDRRSTAARYDIPPGYLPPPGMCRVWVPGEPPGQQQKRHPVGRCSALRRDIAAGAWLIYRPTNDRKHVRVWQYGSERQVLAQRIYDIATGRLIRHVAPASGG